MWSSIIVPLRRWRSRTCCSIILYLDRPTSGVHGLRSHPRIAPCLALSPACLRGGRRVLRSPAGPEDLDRHPVGCGPGVGQVECHVRAGVREQALALADDHHVRTNPVNSGGSSVAAAAFPQASRLPVWPLAWVSARADGVSLQCCGAVLAYTAGHARTRYSGHTAS